MGAFPSATLLAWCALMVGSVLAANVELLGLARDFVFDITSGNKDRIIFSSQGSGVQTFTYYSEGDLTDNIAFYLYGLWTFDEKVTVPPADLKLTLLKTRAGLPSERYQVTDLMTGGRSGISQSSTNIMSALGQQCLTLRDFITYLQADRMSRSSSLRDRLHSTMEAFLPKFPSFFESLLAKALIPFQSNLNANLPQVSPLTGIGRQVSKPNDFNFTWQKLVDGMVETLSIVYDRGVFRLILEASTEGILDLLQTS